MTSNSYKQKATGHVTSLANGHFTGSDASFVCEILTASSNKIINIILLTLDWLWGCPQALLQQRNVSSVRISLANGTKQCLHKTGNLLLELHVPHKQWNSAWPAFLMPFLLLLPVSDPPKSVPTLHYTCRHLLSAVPCISEDRLLDKINIS